MKTEYLEKIIDYTKSKERIKESKYFTKEFFKKCRITKYRELIEKYEEIYFKSEDGTVYCKRKKMINMRKNTVSIKLNLVIKFLKMENIF